VKNNRNFKNELILFGNLKVMVSCALLVAISIVCGKLLAFNIGTVLRFSLENMPIILASIVFGSLIGGVTAVVADLVGCLIVGYEINPIVTVGAFCIGFISGAVYRLFGKESGRVKTVFAVLAAHLVGSVIVKTFGLAKFYEMSFEILLLWRALNYLIIGALEIIIIHHLLKSRSVVAQLERIKQNRGQK
jgi:ECF transporter S component (folate family)